MSSRFCFFFYRFGAHRDLHSFPTRRSSDLGTTCQTCLSPSPSCLSGAEQAAVEREDRKSTRLNSSHRCISYAVFCLKKKKKKPNYKKYTAIQLKCSYTLIRTRVN